MSMHPLDIIRRDMAVAKTLTDRPRRPRQRGGPMAKIESDGGSTGYYDLPEGATTLNDLIEYKEMDFATGNIFKAAYRLGDKSGISEMYDLNKIIYFANRLKNRIEGTDDRYK